jgi:hypothetical protein
MKATRDDAFGAELLFVVEGLPSSAGTRLSGSLRGPDCSRATTLPVTMPLAAVASPLGVAARAVLTEPAPWTPELPNRYRLEARLEGGDESWRQPFGGMIALRRLGRRGRSFRLDGRRFVLRGGPAVAIAEAVASLALARERRHAVVIDADDPSFAVHARSDGPEQGGGGPLEELLDAADREGVFVVVNFCAGRSESVAIRTALHPSAAFVIARDREAADTFAPLRTPSGPLLGLTVDGGSAPPSDTGLADFLVVRLLPGRLPDNAWLASPPPLPLVACRADGGGSKTCDALQATLARWAVDGAGPVLSWDWSGYLLERKERGKIR